MIHDRFEFMIFVGNDDACSVYFLRIKYFFQKRVPALKGNKLPPFEDFNVLVFFCDMYTFMQILQ